MQAAITLPVDSFRLAFARGTMATRHYTTSMSITSQHVSIVERLAITFSRLVWVLPTEHLLHAAEGGAYGS
jgi:hypothetical protein